MRRGSLLTCVVLAAVAVTGCKPLYGGKSQELVTPRKKKHPPDPTDTAVVEVKYVEECITSFHDDPKTSPRPQPSVAQQNMADGDASMQQAVKATEPKAAAEMVKAAVEKYRQALLKNPYDPNAHVKLAVAYDMMFRKGCALALLKRVGDMKRHPKFQVLATRAADDVSGNPTWFRGYRKDALGALGL